MSGGLALLKGAERLERRVIIHTNKKGGTEWMHHLSGHLSPYPPWKNVCQVSWKKTLRNNWTEAGWNPVRFSSRSLHCKTNFHSPENVGSMPKMSTHVLSMSRKHTTGFLVTKLWECLGNMELTVVWPMAVTSLYVWPEVCVRIGGDKSQPFAVAVGLRQRCVLAPILCIVYMNWIDSRNRFAEVVDSVSNPGFPEHETRVFGYFLLPETRIFQLPNPGIWKILELLLHSNITDSDNIEVQDWECNGQISTFELSPIVMRHEVRVLLGYHRTFVVGPLVFSFNW